MSAIAIVGMGCRFGGAADLHEYWKMTLEGRDAFGPVPPDRWNAEVFYDPNPRATDKSYVTTGGWIDGIRTFPALALGLPPRRAEVMDPQQRLAFECCVQAIEDSGRQPTDMPARTGVFMGVTSTEYRVVVASRVIAQLMASGALGRPPEDPACLADAIENVVPSRPFTAPGVLSNMVAATVAQELDLHGAAFTVDSACASGMIAVTQAIQYLRAGELDAALAGGSYVCLTPEHHIAFTRVGAMSPSGFCLPFDERADGFIQGDGVGALVLKRLEDARRDGDRIYAVIHGTATNNDGKGFGPLAPVEDGQVDVVERAWRNAAIDPGRLGYIETHGTGTSVGDITEFNGLRRSLGASCEGVALGSSKANVGHTMSTAGIAGLVRTALAIYHQRIPPMANFRSPKPDLRLDDSPFRIPTAAEDWHTDDRIAGVSSFGFGGTNVHVVVGAGPIPEPAVRQAELVLISAPDEDTLRDLAARTADAVESDPTASPAGVSRAWAVRKALPARAGIVASTREELAEQLRAVAEGRRTKGAVVGTTDGAPKLAFLFPGQGAQRLGMLGDIRARFPVVGHTLDQLEEVLADHLPVPLTQLIYPELRTEPVDEQTAADQLTATEHCQPAMVACGVALLRLLEQVGVRPHATTGHSLGEFTAAAAAGVLSGEDAVRFAARRGRAMADIDGDHGAMAALMVDLDTARSLLPDGAILANLNHPRQFVASGSTEAIDELVARAEAADVRAVRLAVSHGFHSPVLGDLDCTPLLEGLSFHDPRCTMVSGVAPEPYADAAEARAIFARHAVSPVDFMRALDRCWQAGADLYLQVGAGGPLAAFARGSLPPDKRGVLSLASTDDHDGGRGLLASLARLWIEGVDLDPRPITGAAPVASLPPSILPRETYWAVKQSAQLRLELDDIAHHAHVASEAPPPRSEVPARGDPSSGDEVADEVFAIVAKVSAYPRDALRAEMALVEDLGFDSLMVGDLATGLADAFPGLGGIPQELLINRPSVLDLVDYVRGALGGEEQQDDDDAPLQAWEPTWTAAPFTDLPAASVPAGLRVLVTGPGPTVATAASLAEAGLSVLAEEGPADLVVWIAANEPTSVGQVLAGERAWPDPAGDLIATLDRQAAMGVQPGCLAIRRADDAWAEAISGVVRAVAREWTEATCKVISVDALDAVGPLVLRELVDADRSVDVLHRHGERWVMGLEPAQTAEHTLAVGPGHTVLITGGCGGIGATLATHLAHRGARVLLADLADPSPPAAELISAGKAVHLRVDVTDRESMVAAVSPHRPVVAVVHAAGVLGDGALGSVDPARGKLVREVKVAGWIHALAAAGPDLEVALGMGSWAGRFGNRHQAHYAAANAMLSELARHAPRGVRAVVGEFGPWSSSEMVRTIPAVVQATMRKSGVDFVGDGAGLQALLDDLGHGRGPLVHGRTLPHTTRAAVAEEVLAVDTHPFLLDHAIEEVPILPLAAAADLMAWAAAPQGPFELVDLALFQGIAVQEPIGLTTQVRGDRVELRVGDRRALAYRARVCPLGPVPTPPTTGQGEAPTLPLRTFYDEVTFHGPLLQGITAIEAVGEDFVRGRVRTGLPAEWVRDTPRASFTIDPLVLDSAMQLSAYVAWTRFGRAGTPVGMARYAQLRPFPVGEILAEVTFGTAEDDRFTGTLWFRSLDGELLAVAEEVVAELREVDAEEAGQFQVRPEWVDPSTWPDYKDLKMRLDGAMAMGLDNPYFHVHEGTARDTTVVGGRELVNYSSYNYIGLSGDPRVIAAVKQAIDQYGTSVSASRVASGERPYHHELERALAASQGAEDAVVFTAGHATNVGTIGHLMGPKDLILHDELIHDSILQGCKLSGSARRAFRHEDPAHLEEQLSTLRPNFEKVLIAVEGVYSMDGDICDLPAYVELKRRHGCLLMVDEAHSFGVIGATGQGVREHHGLQGDEVDIWMGTLSKSLASCGGWIAGSEALVTYLRYTAGAFVYSAGITPANGVAALTSLGLMHEEPWRVEKLQANARIFHDALVDRGIDTGPALGGSGVVPAVTGNSMHALVLSQRLNDAGVNVQPIVYPAVADDAARLRFFLSSTHTPEQLVWTAEQVSRILTEVRKQYRI